jgi:hypothetical protein
MQLANGIAERNSRQNLKNDLVLKYLDEFISMLDYYLNKYRKTK